MTTLRDLITDDEHMAYLLDNFFTNDARQLFVRQYRLGQNLAQMGRSSVGPFAERLGNVRPNDDAQVYMDLLNL